MLFPQSRALHQIKTFLAKSGSNWGVPAKGKGLPTPGSLLGSLLPSQHGGQNHSVLAGKGDVHQCWVQGKEIAQTPQDAPLCHWGKAEPKGAGAGVPSLRLSLFLTLLW